MYSCTAVARRCIPTFVNVQEQFEDVFSFNTSEGIQNTASSEGLGDLFLNLTVSDLVDGTLLVHEPLAYSIMIIDVYCYMCNKWLGRVVQHCS